MEQGGNRTCRHGEAAGPRAAAIQLLASQCREHAEVLRSPGRHTIEGGCLHHGTKDVDRAQQQRPAAGKGLPGARSVVVVELCLQRPGRDEALPAGHLLQLLRSSAHQQLRPPRSQPAGREDHTRQSHATRRGVEDSAVQHRRLHLEHSRLRQHGILGGCPARRGGTGTCRRPASPGTLSVLLRRVGLQQTLHAIQVDAGEGQSADGGDADRGSGHP